MLRQLVLLCTMVLWIWSCHRSGVSDTDATTSIEPPRCEENSRICYPGAPGTQDVGVCRSGIQRCVDGQWGACEQAVIPADEVCNYQDDNCNGEIDDNVPRSGCGACQEDQCIYVDLSQGQHFGTVPTASGGIGGQGGRSAFKYAWIVQPSLEQVSAIHTQTGKTVVSYSLANLTGYVAVDFTANAWIGGANYLQKINSDTSSCMDPSSCLGETINFANTPGMIIVDANNHLWVDFPGQKFLEKVTGTVIGPNREQISTLGQVIDAVVDSQNILWTIEHTGGAEGGNHSLVAYDLEAKEQLNVYQNAETNHLQSLTLDEQKTIWLGLRQSRDVLRFHTETKEWSHTQIADSVTDIYDIALTSDQQLWLTDFFQHQLYQISSVSGEKLGTYSSGGQNPIALSLDSQGHIWIRNQQSPHLLQLDHEGKALASWELPAVQTMGDIIGCETDWISNKIPFWMSEIEDCGQTQCVFLTLNFKINNLGPWSKAKVFVRISDDQQTWSSWFGPYYTSPAQLELGPARYAQVRIEVKEGCSQIIPEVSQISLVTKIAVCGDGFVDPGEQCDGQVISNGSCTPQCQISCKFGFANCNLINEDGCEVYLGGMGEKVEHCGKCHASCGEGEVCDGGGLCCDPNKSENDPSACYEP